MRAVPSPPVLTADQRQAALDKAAAARARRAELRERLKDGSLGLTELLDLAGSDDVAARTKVVTVLQSLPRLGKVRANRLMDELGIAATRRVAGLTPKQRDRLLERLAAERADPAPDV